METLYIKNGLIKTRKEIIIIKDDFQIINPTEEMVLADGWELYVAPEPAPYQPSPREMLEKYQTKQFNERTDISDEDALEFSILVYDWDTYIDKLIKAGQLAGYDGKVWRVVQDHTVLPAYPPSINTASLYTEVNLVDDGTIDNPIPYNNNMALENGKYYIQDDVIYLCIRDTGVAVYNPLKDLVGIYVEKVE